MHGSVPVRRADTDERAETMSRIKPPTMAAVVSSLGPEGPWHVTVTHAPIQSYSRAVGPRANRAMRDHWKRFGPPRGTVTVEGPKPFRDEWDDPVKDRVRSSFRYRVATT